MATAACVVSLRQCDSLLRIHVSVSVPDITATTFCHFTYKKYIWTLKSQKQIYLKVKVNTKVINTYILNINYKEDASLCILHALINK